MSQNCEESPISDTKMDISDTTTVSQESPDGDQLRPNIQQTLKSKDERLSTLSHKSSTTISNQTAEIPSRNLLDEMTSRSNRELDNRKNSENENVTTTTTSMHDSRSGFTLASSHPLQLMSPNESDSESGHRTHFNYPDVVPEREPLRLANPIANNSTKTNTTTTTSSSQNTLDVISSGLENISVISPSKSESFQGMSSDYLSSGGESEPDLSQYQATVTPTFQSVALVSHSSTRPAAKSIPFTQRKIALTSELLYDDNDVSSVDSLSNHSFDEEIDNNLVSASVSSSVLDDDTGENDVDKDDDIEVASNLPMDPIPPYSAAEESRDLRNWQKITLPDGRTRDIDMKVIEPYKRVLSHGGYLNAGGHNAIVVFSACHLPDRSRADYHYVMDNLFFYVVKTLEQLVTEDYVLIYLHGGSGRSNVPPFPWLKKCYQLLDRRLRKSLKNLFMVHPSFWLKSVVWMARPFISSKFWRKLVYIRTLEELYHLVPVEKAAVPEKVKKYDLKYA